MVAPDAVAAVLLSLVREHMQHHRDQGLVCAVIASSVLREALCVEAGLNCLTKMEICRVFEVRRSGTVGPWLVHVLHSSRMIPATALHLLNPASGLQAKERNAILCAGREMTYF